MKKLIILITLFSLTQLNAQRIKDLGFINGESSEQIIGYGLVVGLSGTGDSQRSSFTVQSITSMLKRFGITVPQNNLRTRNVAAVMVTATLDTYLKPGTKFDVNVASLGDARSLEGGTLLMSPLSGISGDVYGFAQGPISVGGFDVRTRTGSRNAKNHALAGRVPQGGNLQKALSTSEISTSEITIYLKEPDLTTASNVMDAVNTTFGDETAKAVDASEIRVTVPGERQDNIIGFLSELEGLNVEPDFVAKVVLNERTGTVVSGSHVRIQPVTISHGGLNIVIDSYPIIATPSPFTSGVDTKVVYDQTAYASQDSSGTIAIDGASNIQEVAAALNSLKVAPRDIIAIFQALKEAGALVAELVII
ncbi:MAG: flagellar basal body P-ring protein FlgI [Ignavibacteriae bacterium]|jgi:flagellar P-ring protein precursor FlgI|nr:flagellar basal body P-ring protein FlgI [Ignavibacteriota bacterium]NOG97166.1 flagellar basal body P-ring protein FlgI [Ignavibacteriota bacterium]